MLLTSISVLLGINSISLNTIMAPPPEEILNKLIPQIAKEQNFVTYESEIVSISSGGANYATTLYNIIISEDKRVINMFAKVAAAGTKIRAQIPKMFENEIFAYTKLLHVYEKLQEDHKVPPEHRLSVPKFYGCHPTLYEETVVLENLLIEGYMPFDRFKSVDWEYSKSALSQLAKMHALSFAYCEYYPEEFDKVIQERMFTKNKDGEMNAAFKIMIDKAVGVAREETKEKLQKHYENFDLETFIQSSTRCKRKALCHGDFRPSNLMHRIREASPVEIKIVDLQTLQGASPAEDLMYFIFIGTDEEFRAQYYDKMLEHYYTELHDAMQRLHLDPEKVYTKADFDHELKEKLPLGLLVSIFTLPVVTVAEENAPRVGEDMGLIAFSTAKTSELYVERMNGVINDFVKLGVLT